MDHVLAVPIRIAEIVGELLAASPGLPSDFGLDQFRENVRILQVAAAGPLPFNTITSASGFAEEAISLSDQVVVLSAGPASTIVGTYAVDLPRPRNLIDIKTEPYRSIWSDLRKEVLKSYERNDKA